MKVDEVMLIPKDLAPEVVDLINRAYELGKNSKMYTRAIAKKEQCTYNDLGPAMFVKTKDDVIPVSKESVDESLLMTHNIIIINVWNS